MYKVNKYLESSESDDIIKISPRIIDPKDIVTVNGEPCWSRHFKHLAVRPRTYYKVKAMRSAQYPNLSDVVAAAVDLMWNSLVEGKQ